MKRKINEKAPGFERLSRKHEELSYNIELITPMAGGGVSSWHPDMENPVRTQSIKGQLRFWWRTMAAADMTAMDLKTKEDDLWGNTDKASPVRIAVEMVNKVTEEDNQLKIDRDDKDNLQYDEAEVPGYVLFPFQSENDPVRMLKDIEFTLTVTCPPDNKKDVENCIKLWLLFGGLGARLSRGCGSLYCQQVMADLQTGKEIKDFILSVSGDNPHGLDPAKWPVLAGSRFGFAAGTGKEQESSPQSLWCGYLNKYRDFRQGKFAREKKQGSVPGKTLWPEADAIRTITKEHNKNSPRHPDKWFPKAAYGLPVLSDFNASTKVGDPRGNFTLQPKNGERWPSPFIMKVIRLNDNRTVKIWLLLNHSIPELELLQKNGSVIHEIPDNEHPDSYADKQILYDRTVPAPGTSPHDALIAHLGVEEVK